MKVIDELRATPGADVMERAEKLFPRAWADLWFSGPSNQLPRLQERVALALQQYGDERAAAAIDEILYWRKIALELKAELATARETPATAPGQNGR